MADNAEKKLDLILQYLHNRLTDREKLTFYNLLQSDEAFRALFAAEWKLAKEMQRLKIQMSAQQKTQTYSAIIHRANPQGEIERIASKFLEQIWSLFLPAPVVPLFINLKRS